MTPTLSVVIPTLGRDSLKRQLDSLLPQLNRQDEVIVVADALGDYSKASDIVCMCSYNKAVTCSSVNGGFPAVHFSKTDNTVSSLGSAQRNQGIEQAIGHYIWHVDDDDYCSPDAVKTIRNALRIPNSPEMHIFQMMFRGSVLWQHNRIECGNFGTPCLVVANHPEAPFWQVPNSSYTTDFNWTSLFVEQAIPIFWHKGIVQVVEQSSSYQSHL